MKGFVPCRLGAIELIELGAPRWPENAAHRPFLADRYPRGIGQQPISLGPGNPVAKGNLEKILAGGLIVVGAVAAASFLS